MNEKLLELFLAIFLQAEAIGGFMKKRKACLILGILLFSVSAYAGIHAYTHNLTLKATFYEAIYSSEVGNQTPTIVLGR